MVSLLLWKRNSLVYSNAVQREKVHANFHRYKYDFVDNPRRENNDVR